MVRSVEEMIASAGPGLADHIWQSTALALLAGLTTLLLRNNAARYRFYVWVAASVKFVVPLALLVHVGQLLGPRRVVAGRPDFSFAVEMMTAPFGRRSTLAGPHPGQESLMAVLPLLLAVLWSVGFVGTLWLWWVRWRRVAETRRAAEPITEGPEVDALRKVERAAGVSPVPFLLSRSRLEPGIFGIVRPVLLWPSGISEELEEAQIRAILAHEICHVRRRDNLVSAFQMLIEAMFWFHPLVWWLGSRQMEERERACDEGVLELGSEAAEYAEGILKACKFCVESPLPCVAGVNGSNLRKRIVRIMTHNETSALSFGRKVVLAAIATVTVAAPLGIGMANSTTVRAQSGGQAPASGVLHISSLKESHSTGQMALVQRTADVTSITNMTVKTLIAMAYELKEYQLTGGPSWIDQTRYDITYTGDDPTGTAHGMVSEEAIKEVLAQRFHLVLRQETKPGPGFALVVASSGVKFAKTIPPKAPGTDEPLLREFTKVSGGVGEMSITGGPGGLADALSQRIGEPIVDKTGLTDVYNIVFHWEIEGATAERISSDLHEQLGLELIPQESPVQVSVIESIEAPGTI